MFLHDYELWSIMIVFILLIAIVIGTRFIAVYTARQWLKQNPAAFLAWYGYNDDVDTVRRLAFDHATMDKRYLRIMLITYTFDDSSFYQIAYGMNTTLPSSMSAKYAIAEALIKH